MPLHRIWLWPPYIAFLLLLFYFADNAFVLFDFPVDDAWIHRIYSRAISLGQGMAYNTGVQETGSTSPLWTILTAPAQWLEYYWGTMAVVIGVKSIGIALALISIYLTRRIALLLNANAFSASFAALLFACDPRLMFSSLSGMEPILCISLLLAAIIAVLDNRPYLLALLLGLASITRPESLLLFPFFAFALCWQHQQWRYLFNFRLYFIALSPFALWLCFCYSVTGYWLPNTFYAKSVVQPLSIEQLSIAWNALTASGWPSTAILWPSLVALLVLLITTACDRARLALLLIPLSLLSFIFIIVLSRPYSNNGYYWTRWTDPASISLTALLCIGFAQLLNPAQLFPNIFTKHRYMPLLISILTILILLVSLSPFLNSINDRKYHLTMDARVIRLLNINTGLWINQHTPKNAIIAAQDAGGVRYFGQRYTVDILGLNNHDTLHSTNGLNEAVNKADFIVIFPKWFPSSGAEGNFTILALFAIPYAEYTVCNCPYQNEHAIIKRTDKSLQ